MKCVVTGRAGFLGSHLCEWLMDRGGGVVCVDNLITGSTSEVYGDPQVHPQTENYWGHVNAIGWRTAKDAAWTSH